jgi:hypothetical protein
MRHFAPMHRFSSYACAALAGVLFHPGLASAVALGNIALQSSLGQPLRVVIPVALGRGEILNTSCLKLVRDAEPGTPQLLTGRVSVERNAASTRLVVTTPRAMDEPALRLTIEAGCGDTVRRDYVLLLDPQGIRSDAMVASADIDEFRNYVASAPPASTARRVQRIAAASVPASVPASVSAASPVASPVRPAAAVIDIAPARTTFVPIAAPAPVALARTQKPVPPAPVIDAMVPPPAPRELVALTTVKRPSGFIPEAAAASLSRVSTEGPNALTASPQTALLGTQAPAPEETLWTQTWPYAAILLSIVAIALTAFAKRRGAVVPAWGAPTVLNNSKSPMGNSGHANTFAHFGAMTEPAPPVQRRAMAYPTVAGDSTYDASLDTLLEQTPDDGINLNMVDDNVIDEHTVRKAWATLATESAVDIGTDSILKAIAEAERDLRIGPPEPKQAAIDKALDDDLMRVSKDRR